MLYVWSVSDQNASLQYVIVNKYTEDSGSQVCHRQKKELQIRQGEDQNEPCGAGVKLEILLWAHGLNIDSYLGIEIDTDTNMNPNSVCWEGLQVMLLQ